MLTWIPNGDYTQPGALKDITNAWPTNRGYRPARRFDTYDNGTAISTTSLGSGPKDCSGSAAIIGALAYGNVLSASFHSLKGNIKGFYSNGSLNRTVGGAYDADAIFQFAMTSDTCYATNGVDTMQKFSFATSSTFENVASSVPVFKFLLTLGTQLVGFNTVANIAYNGTTYFASGSRWWCSQAGAMENFTPSVAANCATDKLDDQDGEIVAAIELNGYAVVFKRSGIYIGEFVGPPVVMAWRKVHSEYGCVSRFGLTKVDNRIYFVSPTNNGEICMFDGASVVPLSYQLLGSLTDFTNQTIGQPDVGGSTGVSSNFYGQVSAATYGDLVMFCRPNLTSGFGLRATIYVYNIRTGRFGITLHDGTTNDQVPLAIWTGAEGRSVGAVVLNVVTNRCTTARLSANPVNGTGMLSTFTQYRESYNGKKYAVNAAQAYFLGSLPTGTQAFVDTELPTGQAYYVDMATDGRFTFANLAGARVTNVVKMQPNTDYELTRLELNVGEAGDNKSAPKGILT